MNSRFRKAFLVLLCACFVLMATAALVHDGNAEDLLPPAPSYSAGCQKDDPACAAWSEFRRNRPYPYQAFLGKPLPEGGLVLIISESAPVFSKTDFEKFIKVLFGADLNFMQRMQWKIGIDGWVEDLVLRVKSPFPVTVDSQNGLVIDDPILRDRMGLLSIALYGTTYGGYIEAIPPGMALQGKSSAPNLQVSPKELNEWLSGTAAWIAIEGSGENRLTWDAISKGKISGTFKSEDGSLVMLTFPTRLLESARSNIHSLDSLRGDFRRFAVSGDTILGGAWPPGGQTAILARARISPYEALPPLRFETFALLASQSEDELQQSYERTGLFSGKVISGEYILRDWAPIFLSDVLIDTEFGALLNITDQMLKSWSEAGSIEYIYFNYPLKPNTFPFEQGPLSKIVKETTGGGQVLFNWNTSGSAAIFASPDLNLLTTRQTGALPVTYGSDMKAGGAIEFGHLIKYEETAYDYFAGLKDPNLARVVQYTLMYQIFRAAAPSTNTVNPQAISVQAKPNGTRTYSKDPLLQETRKLLKEVTSGQWKPVVQLPGERVQHWNDYAANASKSLKVFREKYPEIDDARLVALLINPGQTIRIMQVELQKKINAMPVSVLLKLETLEREERANVEEQERLRLKLQLWASANSVSLEDLDQPSVYGRMPASIRNDFNNFAAASKSLEEHIAAIQQDRAAAPYFQTLKLDEMVIEVAELTKELHPLALLSRDLNTLCHEYISRNAGEARYWIRTPSVVLSWSRQRIETVGGHNLTARALRFEPSRDVASISVSHTADGVIIKYNPSLSDAVGTQAPVIARKIEHGKVTDTAEIQNLLAAPSIKRTKFEALEMPGTKPVQEVKAQLGERVYPDLNPFTQDIRKIAESNDCCVFVARDKQAYSYLTEKNPSPPPTVRIIQVRDTPSLTGYFRQHGLEKPIVFLDQPPEHVSALAMDINADFSNPHTIWRLAEKFGKKELPGAGSKKDSMSILHVDLEGRSSSLELAVDPKSTEASRFEALGLAGVHRLGQQWQKMNVSVLGRGEAESFVKSAGWDVARDGAPAAVLVRLSETAGSKIEMGIVGGFEKAKLSEGENLLKAAHEKSFQAAISKGGSIAQYFMSVKNDLLVRAAARIKRLELVIQAGESRHRVTLLEKSDESAQRL